MANIHRTILPIAQAVTMATPGTTHPTMILNAAAALVVSGKTEGLSEGAKMAAGALDGGGARKALDGLIGITNERFTWQMFSKR